MFSPVHDAVAHHPGRVHGGHATTIGETPSLRVFVKDNAFISLGTRRIFTKHITARDPVPPRPRVLGSVKVEPDVSNFLV